jgi:hypothetical protein
MVYKVFPDVRVGYRFQRLYPNPLLSFGPAPRTSSMKPLLAEPPLMGFPAPSAFEAGGSDQHRACLTRLCCAFGLSQTLDALFLPRPSRLCFTPRTLMGFLSPEVFPPLRPEHLSMVLPLLTFRSGPLPRPKGFQKTSLFPGKSSPHEEVPSHHGVAWLQFSQKQGAGPASTFL